MDRKPVKFSLCVREIFARFRYKPTALPPGLTGSRLAQKVLTHPLWSPPLGCWRAWSLSTSHPACPSPCLLHLQGRTTRRAVSGTASPFGHQDSSCPGGKRTDVLHDLSRHARMGEMLTECCDQTQNGPHVLASSATSRAA